MFKTLERTAVAEFDLVAKGPVLVSSGKSNKTNPTLPDATFLFGRYGDGDKLTYVIPGSTIKGVIRNYCGDSLGKDENLLFGSTYGNGQKSKISFHDAYADIDTVVTNIRHSTAIEPHTQSAKHNSLNNMQVIEKGTFKAGFRIVNFTDNELWTILDTLEKVNMEAVRFGGRKSRGFGLMSIKNFKITISGEYNSDFERKSEVFDSLDEAYWLFGKES